MRTLASPPPEGGQPQGNPIIKFYQDWANLTPCVTRLSVLGMIWVYLFSWFFDLDSILGNMTYYTFMWCEIYRILLSPLVGNSFLTIILLLLFYPSMGTRMENSMGSSAFLSHLITLSVTGNLMFNLICLTGWLCGLEQMLIIVDSGFWNVVFSLIVIDCLAMPDVPRRLLCFPWDIPSRNFPLVLFLFFVIFSGSLDQVVGLLCGMIVGYLYGYNYFDRFKPSSTYLAQLESTGLLKEMTKMQGWVPVGNAMGHTAWMPVSQSEHGAQSQPSAWGAWAQTSGAGAQQPEMFPGSAHTLAGSSSSSSNGTWATGFPQLGVVSAPSMDTSGSGMAPSAPSREEIAARRLAALEAAEARKSTPNNSTGGDAKSQMSSNVEDSV